jgi:hypothetical protein
MDRLFDLIEEAADRQDWERQREISEEILALEPDNSDAQTFLAAAERSLSRATGKAENIRPPRVESTLPPISTPGTTSSSYSNSTNQGHDILEELNLGQKEAVETIDGPLLITGGPGSGKTRVITHRIAYLVRDYGISPYRILAMTFTNKAARGMRDRLERLVGTQSDFMTVGTFHSFCTQLLRQEGGAVGLSSTFSVYDADKQLSLIKQALELADLDPGRNLPQAIRSVISRAKSVMLDARGLLATSKSGTLLLRRDQGDMAVL